MEVGFLMVLYEMRDWFPLLSPEPAVLSWDLSSLCFFKPAKDLGTQS